MDRFIIELAAVINGPEGFMFIVACAYVIIGCLNMRAIAKVEQSCK